ncbi:PAS domain S-box protein [Candidatus Sumerlaeota bacterium]|nr:PAS domain S-box protein [Candidatus Sumerlaeota bacterium]
MASRRLQRRRTVNRLLLRVLALGALVAVLGAVWSARSLVHSALLTSLEENLRYRAETVARLATDGAAVEDLLADVDLTEALVFAPDESDDLRCVAATHSDLIGQEPWELAMTRRGDLPTFVSAASGEVTMAGGADLADIALPIGDEGAILYASLSVDSIASPLRATTLGALWRAVLIAAVVMALVMTLLALRLTAPLQRLAQAAKEVSESRAGAHMEPEGPDEIVSLGAAISAIASEAQAQRRLAEDEAQRWRSLFDEIPSPAFVFSSSGRVLLANRRAGDLLEMDPEVLCQRTRDNLIDSGGSLRLPDDERMSAHWVESSLVHEGRPAVLAIAIDLRALRTAQARLRHLGQVLDEVDLMILDLDTEGRIQACNRETTRRLGETSEALHGRALTEIFSERPALPPWSQIAATLRAADHWTGEGALRTRSGSLSQLRLRIAAMPAVGDSGPGSLAVAHDVTELRSAQDELTQLRDLSRLGPLAGMFAGEIQRIVKNTIIYTSHLRSLCGEEATLIEGLGSIESNVRRAAEISQRIRLFARRAAMRIAKTDLSPILQRIAAAPAMISARNVTVTIDIDNYLPEIPTDGRALAEALRAIVRNALDALPRGGTVAIAAHCDPEGTVNRRVHIRVSDSGRGMDAVTLRHAMEPLYTTREGAEGLGLTTAAGLIHLLGGEITIHSPPSQGVTVEIALPLTIEEQESLPDLQAVSRLTLKRPKTPAERELQEKVDRGVEELLSDPAPESPVEYPEERVIEDAESEEDEEIEEESEEEELEEDERDEVVDEEGTEDEDEEAMIDPGEGPPVLLLVDDEQIVLDLVCDIFEDEPFEVVPVLGGKAAVEALEILGDRHVMAVVDLSMPDLNGWEVAAALAEQRPGLSIHIASGYDTEEEDIPEEVRDVIAGLIRKPFRAGMLRDLIEKELIR